MQSNSFNYINKNILLNIVLFILSITILYIIINLLFNVFDKNKINVSKDKKNKFFNSKFFELFDKHPIIFSMIFIIILWLPYIICFYPAILSRDGMFQIMQFFNIPNKYSTYVVLLDKNVIITNHHPVIHTLLLGGSLKLGHMIGNDNFGLFIYSIIQILILSFTLSYTINFMKKIKINKIYRFICLLIYSLVPVFPFYSMTTVKDVIFSCFVILYLISLYNIIKFKDVNVKSIIKLVLISVMVILFRNNGIYVILLSLPFTFISNKKQVKNLLLAFLIIILFNITYNKVILPGFKITQTSIREALSIPFQQTARYVKEHPKDVTGKDEAIIDKILHYDNLAQRYDPELSDPVKELYNKYATKNDLKAYFEVWFKEGLKHPKTYIEATINNTYGYIYPVKTNWYIYHKPELKINESGFDYHYNKLENSRNILIIYGLIFPYIIILGLVVNIAFNFWMIMFMIMYLIYKKRYKGIILLLPSFVLFLVCLASPANTYYRYALPVIFQMPLLLGIFIKEGKYD